MIKDKIKSERDGLVLDVAVIEPKSAPKAIVQFSHGMAEHKERYFEFAEFLSVHGFVCVIHDHRGHGKSVKNKEDLGYFYTENADFIVDDLHCVTKYAKKKYPNLPLYLFSHSMGTLVARNYLKKYDFELEKLVLCGPPTENKAAGSMLIFAKVFRSIFGERNRSGFLNGLAEGGYNKGFDKPNSWINSDEAEVEKFTSDELCGYIFTINGYINLLSLLKGAYDTKDWTVRNKNLDIFIIAGADDPVIVSPEKTGELEDFLNNLGYKNTRITLYNGMRHEILNEKNKKYVYADVLNFFEKTT